MANKKKQFKIQNFTQLILSMVIIILINIIGSFAFFRLDLTSEKRYSLSDATKEMLKKVDDIVYFKVYLEGDFPAGFKRLSKETKEMLDEFRAYNKNIQYEFINPTKVQDKEDINNLYKQLINKGLLPTTIKVKKTEGFSQQVIFPGAIVSYREKELPLQLLNTQNDVSPDDVLNNSIQSLEYGISNVIKKITTVFKPKIAFIGGHGELNNEQIADISSTLGEYYEVSRININHHLKSLDFQKAIVIAQPDSSFDEKDKYVIDQYIMKGGKVLWLIDPVYATMDSLQTNNETVGFAPRLNLDDMLFNYGVRLNSNLILDMQAAPIPMITGKVGNQPEISLVPWYFFPIITPLIKHPIVNNLNSIKFEFASTLDTIGAVGITKTFLLTTSQKTKLLNTPCRISLNIAKNEIDERLFNKSNQPVAVLLEGEFKSLYQNRLLDDFVDSMKVAKFAYVDKSKKNKMIVVSDGDIIRNQFQNSNGKITPLPLGYDKYTRTSYGNKDFILNAINFLCDDSGLISARSKVLTLRLLDKAKIVKDRLFWQLLNALLPVLIIIVFGISQNIYRKRKYANN
ncbi:MAG: gliding motility-associated ABC transporter substrate-binding protein GldG [Bacteroidetes bacterium CG2_30_32_10]|nr:MAG: gliding motility-associated ABC transporter substrate-binding protein GldG [Bacteroidetes bacterium CG2_30_32_10]